jgi:anti-sigma B factor antagonist
MSEASILLAVCGDGAHLKPVGRANLQTATQFKTAFEALRGRGFRRFVVDLAECAQMDSTFLGVLAGSAMTLAGGGEPAAPAIELCQPSDRIVKLLSELGVDRLFRISRGTLKPLEYEGAPAVPPTRASMTQTSLEAHETLMSVNPDNRLKFKDVVAFLREDLAKAAPGAPLDRG